METFNSGKRHARILISTKTGPLYLNLEGQTFEKNRIYSGVSFELTKNVESELYYVWQSGKFDDQWKDLNALGFQIEILF
jgi:hypothetical protein